jgi:TetR/AcrR family transcriptional repressor of nem operon
MYYVDGDGTCATAGTRDRIMAVAKDFFFQHGFKYVSVDDICLAAHVKKGSFYHFFPAKEDLLLAVMTQDRDEWMGKMELIFSPTLPPLTRMAALARGIYLKQKRYLDTYGMVVGLPYVTLGSEAASLFVRICKQSESQCGLMETYFIHTLEDAQRQNLVPAGLDVVIRARQMLRFMMGVLTDCRLQNELDTMENDLREYFSLCFNNTPLPPAPEFADTL